MSSGDRLTDSASSVASAAAASSRPGLHGDTARLTSVFGWWMVARLGVGRGVEAEMRCTRSWSVAALAVLGSGLAAATAGAAPPHPRGRVAAALVHPEVLSQGARGWLQRPGAAP